MVKAWDVIASRVAQRASAADGGGKGERRSNLQLIG